MSDEPSHSFDREPRTITSRRKAGRLWRLVLKELREILRDRRTIITLVVMPLLIYPLLAVVFQRFLVTSLSVSEDVHYLIGVDSPIGMQMLNEQLKLGDAALAEREREGAGNAAADEHELQPSVTLVEVPVGNLKRFVEESSLHLAAVPRYEDQPGDGDCQPDRREIEHLIRRAQLPRAQTRGDDVGRRAD